MPVIFKYSPSPRQMCLPACSLPDLHLVNCLSPCLSPRTAIKLLLLPMSADSQSKIKTCEMAQGQEPNYLDEGCKSYWYCEDHHGTLHECPTGFQFQWDKLDCVRDDEVFCEKLMEYYYEHVYYHQVICLMKARMGLEDERDALWRWVGMGVALEELTLGRFLLYV